MKTLSRKGKVFGAFLIVILAFSAFFYLGYTYGSGSTLVVTPSNLVTLDSNGGIAIGGNYTGASLIGNHFYWVNGTELGGGSGGGSVWYNGTGVPSAGLGLNGDYYLRLDNGYVYNKVTGSWVQVANLTGPTGATGATGATGSPGPSGTPGSNASATQTLPFTNITVVPAIGSYSYIIQADDPVAGNYSARYPNGSIAFTSTNQTTVAQNAINALPSTGGGIMISNSISGESNKFGSLTISKSNVYLYSEGIGDEDYDTFHPVYINTLTLDSSSNSVWGTHIQGFMIRTLNNTGSNTNARTLIEDCSIQGSNADSTTWAGYGVIFNFTQSYLVGDIYGYTFRNVHFQDANIASGYGAINIFNGGANAVTFDHCFYTTMGFTNPNLVFVKNWANVTTSDWSFDNLQVYTSSEKTSLFYQVNGSKWSAGFIGLTIKGGYWNIGANTTVFSNEGTSSTHQQLSASISNLALNVQTYADANRLRWFDLNNTAFGATNILISNIQNAGNPTDAYTGNIIAAINVAFTDSYSMSQVILVGQAVTTGQVLFHNSTGYFLANALTSSTLPSYGVCGIATESVASGAACSMLTTGKFTYASYSWSAGSLYVSNSTSGAMIQTPPLGTGQQSEQVAQALSTTTILFNPKSVVGQ
jgi:hypothetical protein